MLLIMMNMFMLRMLTYSKSLNKWDLNAGLSVEQTEIEGTSLSLMKPILKII